MLNFIITSFLGALLITLTCLITFEVLEAVLKILPRLGMSRRLKVLLIIAPIFVAHIINIWLYATAYFLVENYTSLGALSGQADMAELSAKNFIERLYYSASVYTSLGLGDIVPTKDLRMLTSAEVLNGLVMIG